MTEDQAGTAPESYRGTIEQYLRVTLKDPYSIRDFDVGLPMLDHCAIGIYGSYWGWRVRAEFNAKNSYGAYIGRRTYFYWFQGEQLKGVSDAPNYCPAGLTW